MHADTLTSRRLTVATQLGPAINAQIAAHWSKPMLRVLAPDEPPWQLDLPADVLLVRPLTPSWRAAPAVCPAGWPGPVRVVMTASAGVDFFPPWLLAAPVVACACGVTAAPIAEYVLAAMLGHAKRLDAVRMRGPADFRQSELAGLEGATLGIAGYGAIGQAVASRARAFGMTILALRRSSWEAAEGVATERVEAVRDIGELASRADHLVLALPATGETRHIVNAAVLAKARPGLHLINIARGTLIDQQALLAALDAGQIAAATLDVTDPEPLDAGHALYTHHAVRLTPHISWSSAANGDRLARKLLDNLDRFARNEPLRDVVDPVRGY